MLSRRLRIAGWTRPWPAGISKLLSGLPMLPERGQATLRLLACTPA